MTDDAQQERPILEWLRGIPSQPPDPQETIYYDALLRAFIDLRRERDRTLLALSTGGIGLLVTLLTAFGLEAGWTRALYFAAVAFFLVTIVLALWILGQDSKYIGAILRENAATRLSKAAARAERDARLQEDGGVASVVKRVAACAAADAACHAADVQARERRLRLLDRAAFGSFLFALVASAAFGFSQGTVPRAKEGESMAHQQTNAEAPPTTRASGSDAERSLVGLADLKPGAAVPAAASKGEGLSLEGISGLKPTAATTVPAAPPQATAPATPPQAAAPSDAGASASEASSGSGGEAK